jgi:MFS family permease
VLGTGAAFANTPLMAEVTYVITEQAREHPGAFGERGVYGLGYGLFTMAFALGGVVGPLWAGYVYDGPGGWGTMTWTLALWAASAAVVAFVWLGNKPQLENDNAAGEEPAVASGV